MSNLISHGEQKYTTGTRLMSSRERDWTGLLAECWAHREGDLADVEPRDTEIVVLIDGCVNVRRRGDGRLQDTVAVPGTVWICPAGIREDMIRISGNIRQTVHMYIPASPFSTTALEDVGLDPDNVKLRYDGGFHDPFIEQIGRAVHQELLDPCLSGPLLVESLGMALSAYVLRNHSNLNPSSVQLPKTAGSLDMRRRQRVMDYITANLDQPLTLADLAAEACLSRFHFARAFKAATGKPPHRYIMEQRLKRAMGLLESREQSLSAVGALCGFTSQAYFTKAFKQATGMTPGAFRERT